LTWTDERLELLKKLWADGLSADRIAVELGGVSRNSVIGKIHRLGLTGRARTANSTTRTRPIPQSEIIPTEQLPVTPTLYARSSSDPPPSDQVQPTKPYLLMIAGPNGSGKTTLTTWLRSKGLDFGEYINPDDIAHDLSGPYDARVKQAQSVAEELRISNINAGRSFSFETVMSHPSKIDILKRAKDNDFFVQLFFIGIDDPGTNVDRVQQRVAIGGGMTFRRNA
jgi:GcrA cell cycle regulator/Zeta toxin